jgi:hypothetical protein
MQSLRGAGVIGVLVAAALIGAPAASASIEVGDECAANVAEGPYSLIPEARASGGGLPLATPSGGVITTWKVNSAFPAPVFERMAAFRPTAEPGSFQVIGESNEETVNQGTNTFLTRIPVQAGDRFGPVGIEVDSPVYCFTDSEDDNAWVYNGSVGLGSSHTFIASTQIRVPLIAVIEPDRDGDGYGDETQDGCPQSAAYHGPCPTITLDAFPIVLKRSVLILVSASETSSVQVFGQVGWKARHKGGALASKTPNPGGDKSVGVIVGLTGGSETVQPGEVASFNVKLPKSVKRQLAQTPRGKSLKGTITAQTTDLAGRIGTHTITIRLPGQGPKHP